MNGRDARALRRAAGYKPRAERSYETLQTPQVFTKPGVVGGQTRIQIQETIVNIEGSPRDQYRKIKKLFKAGEVSEKILLPEFPNEFDKTEPPF